MHVLASLGKLLLVPMTVFPLIATARYTAGMPSDERVLEKQTIVFARLADVWSAWTTTHGAVSFFAPQADIELRIGGTYELYFDPDAAEGSRGSEGMKILSFDWMRMLSFQWNAPTRFPEIRKQPTHVSVYFTPIDSGITRVTLRHSGWKQGGDWEDVYQYFDRAWSIVLARLKHRFEAGPIDWKAPYMPGQKPEAGESFENFILRLSPARKSGTPDAERSEDPDAVAKHYAYLKGLLAEGVLLDSGVASDDLQRIVIIRAADQTVAARILANDPAILSGAFRGSVHPYRSVLVAK